MQLTHQGTVAIETERLRLRRLRQQDAAAMFRWAGDPEVAKYLAWKEHANIEVSRAEVKKRIDSYARDFSYEWGIELKAGPVLIGSIGLPRLTRDTTLAEIGYCIGREYWNRGIMTEALAAVIDFCFERVGLLTLMAKHHVENRPSGRVMQKCGMRYLGCRPVNLPLKESTVMCDFYAVTRDEWQRRRQESASPAENEK